MANLPFWRGEDPFRTLFQEVQKTFEDFSRRTPFARFSWKKQRRRSKKSKSRRPNAEKASTWFDEAQSLHAGRLTCEMSGRVETPAALPSNSLRGCGHPGSSAMV